MNRKYTRRSFLKFSILGAGALMAFHATGRTQFISNKSSESGWNGSLITDTKSLFDLPECLSYKEIMNSGDLMSDDLFYGGDPDGMEFFELPGNKLALVVNHETSQLDKSLNKATAYRTKNDLPYSGGTSTIVLNQEKLTVEDSGEIIPIQNQTNVDKNISLENNLTPKSSFLLEKHLEDYIIKNWSNIELNKNYDIHKENNKLCTQYSTGSGPLDILAISKDQKEFLVIELKKGRASDIVMGQIQRYMGHIKNNLAADKDVKGLIIALEDDKNLRDALSVAPNIKFMKYEVSFKLVE